MSAKEVYYNEAGKKVTVKLLHFPDVLPEDIAKLRFEDDDEDDDDDDDDDGVDSDAAAAKANAADTEDAGSDAECNAAAGGGSGSASAGSGNAAGKKIFRRKLSGNNMQTRKCSLAFAQAHGIKQRAEKKLSMPTISITANAGEHVSLASGRKLSQQHSQPATTSPMMMMSPPRRTHSPLGKSLCPGYIQYSKSLLEVPMPRDYGYASSDDLSSEWDSDVSTSAATSDAAGGAGATGASTASGTKKVSGRSCWRDRCMVYPTLSAAITYMHTSYSNYSVPVNVIQCQRKRYPLCYIITLSVDNHRYLLSVNFIQ